MIESSESPEGLQAERSAMEAPRAESCWASRRNGALCALLVVTGLLIAHPFAEMGFVDDFSYIKTAQIFAQTGHLVYNGWATAMLGWAVPWGALFIHVLGFSFTAVRLSTLPLAMLSVYLFHSSLRRFGVREGNAVFGTLTLGFSPLFFPLSATYMTDVPGLLVVLLCLYLCQRALQANSNRGVIAWLIAATLMNVLGGTVRQISWLGALIMVPSAAWLLSRRAGVKLAAVCLWVCSLLGIVACLHWFQSQPYSLAEKIIQGPVRPKMLAHAAAELLKSLLCLLLVLLPIVAAWLSRPRDLSRGARRRIGLIVTALTGAALALGAKGTLEHRVMPWLGHVIGTLSIFPSTGEMLGSRPVTLIMPMRVAISLIVIAAALALAEQLWAARNSVARPTGGLQEALWLLAPFSVSYVIFLIPRATYSFIYDRYLLGLMPAGIVLLLLLYQRWRDTRLPGISVTVLVFFSVYTVLATHDWFSLNRARASAVAQVHASGVPLTSIQGGFDYDGWTQIEAVGYINDERIKKPAGAFQPNLRAATLPEHCRLNFAAFTPSIDPIYFVVFEPMPCLAPSRFGPVSYRNWLPPFTRTIYIEQRRGTAAGPG